MGIGWEQLCGRVSRQFCFYTVALDYSLKGGYWEYLYEKKWLFFVLLVCELYGNYGKECGSIQETDTICSFGFDGDTFAVQSNHWAQYIGVLIHYFPLCFSLYLCLWIFGLFFSFTFIHAVGGGDVLQRGFLFLHLFMVLLLSATVQKLLALIVFSRAHLLILDTILKSLQHPLQVPSMIIW